MTDQLKLMLVVAHPDDETLGNGATIARYADEGVEVHLVTATGGEDGWFGDPEANPGGEAVAQMREAELRGAAAVLGVKEVSLLGYRDGRLAKAPVDEAVGKVVSHIRRVRPQVVVTFDNVGLYGHPDHIAVCQLTTAATVRAASSYTDPEGREPHQVSKLYYMAWTQGDAERYQEPFGPLVMEIDGQERVASPLPDWAITTRIDAPQCWHRVWEAVRCHRSQLPAYKALLDMPEDWHQRMWSTNRYYRAFTTVNCGDGLEEDLFAGLR
jgi:LmbE family N-acetylglucosaminyl deacetylase